MMKNLLTKEVLKEYSLENEADEIVLQAAKTGFESAKILYDVKPLITNIWMNMSGEPNRNPQLPVIESLLLRIDNNLSAWTPE
jgi:hypothetical protein